MAADPAEPRVAFVTLGCKVNRTESEAAAEDLIGRGARIADPGEPASVVVVNTCTVTGEADAKARKAVRQALAAPAAPVVVVTGCLAAVDADALRALGERVVVEADRGAVAPRVAHLLELGEGAPATPAPRSGAAFRTRVMVKVQDGCDARCTYCIVPDARGLPASVPRADVVARVAALAAGGTAEVVLTGVNIGRYSDGGLDLAGLVREVAATGIARIRVSSIEPLDLTPRLLDALAGTPAVLPHLHVPLQSGCDRTLAAMGRRYSLKEFADALARARQALPGSAVTTDVIVGFPGETAQDHAESVAFVEECAFAGLHVFRFSRRAGTPAAAMPAQVPPPESAERAAAMRALGARLACAHARARVGGIADVLVESIQDGRAAGTSEDHLRVDVRGSAAVGEVVRVRITGADGARVEGVLEPTAG